MKNFKEFIDKSEAYCKLAHIPFAEGRIDYKIVSTGSSWATCYWQGISNYDTAKFTISISNILFDDDASDNGLLSTIIHEIIHTCNHCQDHGTLWQRYADRINKTYHLGVKRTNSSLEKGVNANIMKKYRKYVIMCPKCGEIWGRSKLSSIILDPDLRTCGHCGHKHLVRVK